MPTLIRRSTFGKGRLEEFITLSPNLRGKLMSFPGFFNSQDLAMLTAVLDEFCLENGYGPGPDRDAAAGRIMDLFTNGVSTSGELLSVLREREMIPREA